MTSPPETSHVSWPESTGILLIAIHRPHYGELAYNMALSIKLADREASVTVVADDTALTSLSPYQRRVFDQIIEPEAGHYIEVGGIKNPFRLKTWLDHYTPYRQTLYLDVDGVFFTRYRDPRELVARFASVELHIQEEFRYDKDRAHVSNHYFWGSLAEIWQAYSFPDEAVFVDYNSSLIWFRESIANHRFFERAREVYDNPKAVLGKIGQLANDEAPFSIASAQLGHYSPIPEFRPLYLQNFSEQRPWRPDGNSFEEFTSQDDFRQVIEAHYFVSLPAIPPTRSVVKLYHHFVQNNARAAGDDDFFAFRVEKKLLKEWLDEQALAKRDVAVGS